MPEPLTIAAIGGALLNAFNSSRESGRANALEQEAIDRARARDAELAPTREAFIKGSLTPIAEAPDLSAVFSDPSNPFFTGGVRLPQVASQLDFSGINPGGVPTGVRPGASQPEGAGDPGMGDSNIPLPDPGLDIGPRLPLREDEGNGGGSFGLPVRDPVGGGDDLSRLPLSGGPAIQPQAPSQLAVRGVAPTRLPVRDPRR